MSRRYCYKLCRNDDKTQNFLNEVGAVASPGLKAEDIKIFSFPGYNVVFITCSNEDFERIKNRNA